MALPRVRVVTVCASLLIIALLWTTGGGCVTATTGTPIDQQKIKTIQKGVTNKTQMESMFGQPTNVSLTTDGSGRRIATWVHSYTEAQATTESYIPIVNWFSSGANATTNMEQLQVIYNTADVVDDVQYSASTTNSQSQGGMLGQTVKTTTAPTEPSK